MSDDRAFETAPEQVGRIEQDLADLRAMVNARMARRPTGDMELSWRATPKDGTLLCNGQAVSRTTYADLYQWAVDQGLMGGIFGNGDGSTTFTVPDVRDRFLAASGTAIGHGSAGGQASRTLTQAELPSHTHTATTTVPQHAAHDHTLSGASAASGGGHTHGGSTGGDGGHSGHNAGARNVASALQGSQDFFFSVANTTQNSVGDHTHSLNIASVGGHTHTVSGDVGSAAAMSHTASTTVNATGSGQAFDQRPPWIGLAVYVWT